MPRTKTTLSTDQKGKASPTRFSMAEWKQILVRVKNEIASDHISVVSAGIAFYALLSVFPALVLSQIGRRDARRR